MPSFVLNVLIFVGVDRDFHYKLVGRRTTGVIGIALLCSSELFRADGRLHLRRAVGALGY